nr:cysteine dioxygenase type 1 isoform X1 [Rattus norvegicus]|eukprot:XP_006254760.1 PREDICTED: cysteine dioxygenase type 1 isoform X1 [Rattus norvegicus]
MERTELLKPRTLADLIRILHELFAGDEVNVEEVQAVLEAYESNPAEWALYAKFDQYRYTRNLVDQGNGKFNLMILCWGEGHGSSIHDHTDSHCFLKLLQGNLKETLFDWPDKKSNEMIKKSERTLRENQCAYINDNFRFTGEQLRPAKPFKVLLLGRWNVLPWIREATHHLLSSYTF